MNLFNKSIFTCIFFSYILFLTILNAEQIVIHNKNQKLIFLNQEEKIWLSEHNSSLKVGINIIPNQMLLDKNGKYKGLFVDVFRKVEQLLDIKINFVEYNSWDKLINAAKKKEIDIIYSAQKTQARLDYLDFTDIVLSLQNKIIVSNNMYDTVSMEDLFGKKVAVAKGSALYDYIQNTYPRIELVASTGIQDSLLLVKNKTLDATIAGAVRTSYYMSKNNIKNLHIAGDSGYNYDLRIANRNDMPMLSIVLNKAVNAIPKQQINALKLKWGYTKDKVRYIDPKILVFLVMLFGIILPMAIYLYFVNKNLKKEILKRKKVIQTLKKTKNEVHALKILAEKEARTDGLTNIANKRSFDEVLLSEIERYNRTHEPFSLILLDIDNFKKINDNMGHTAGDIVLRGLTDIVKSRLRNSDYFARLGGDEYAIILPNTTLQDASHFADIIRGNIKKHTCSINNHSFSITASFGISEVETNDTPEIILTRTDIKLYKSKSEGRDCITV